ncbi:hypothetical protein ABUL04_10755 [Micromonospora harpali]|uniref:Uncharacterized protein n=1 Tax=Micromonospora harpali TaxID=1490225 RepID=A0ABW1HN20_9ACTN
MGDRLAARRAFTRLMSTHSSSVAAATLPTFDIGAAMVDGTPTTPSLTCTSL